MYRDSVDNPGNSVDKASTHKVLPEPLGEDQLSNVYPDTEGKITDEELLNHCRCHIVEGHMHWFCDKEVYRDRLVGLLEKEPLIELETNSSLDE